MTNRSYYSSPLNIFHQEDPNSILGELSQHHSQDLVQQQTGAWRAQIQILKQQLVSFAKDDNIDITYVLSLRPKSWPTHLLQMR